MPWHECSVVMLREKFVRFAGEEGNSLWPSLPTARELSEYVYAYPACLK